jgi:hypothetical protein
MAMDSPTIDLIAAWWRDGTASLPARIADEIRERSAALLTTA